MFNKQSTFQCLQNGKKNQKKCGFLLSTGVDVLHLISTPFPSVWHKMTDDADHLDFDLIGDFSRIFRVFLANLLHLEPENIGCRKK